MAWLAVDKNGDEVIYSENPKRITYHNVWMTDEESDGCYVLLPVGSIKKLIGRSLSWDD